MLGVLQGFATIGLIVALGWLLAHTRVLDESAQVALSRLAFHAASPALLLVVMQRTPLDQVLSANLATALVSFVVVACVMLAGLRRRSTNREMGDVLVAMLSAGYANAGNLGLPIAQYVLGDVAWVAPALLCQLLLITPVFMGLFDRADAAHDVPWARSLLGVFRNPITLGALTGLGLAVFDLDLPSVLATPVELVGSMAVPSMLVAFGISLRRGPRPALARSNHLLWWVLFLKLVLMPAVALGVGYGLGLRGVALFAVVVVGALPTAQNIFTYAVRYNRSIPLARDAIFVSTFASLPVVLAIAWAFHATGAV